MQDKSSYKHVALVLFFILLAPCVSSFEIDSPRHLFVGENTTVSLHDDQETTRDVKIFIGDATRPTSLTYVVGEGWKNSKYYLSEAYPSQHEFTIQPLAAAGDTTLCVRLRKPRASSYIEECTTISIENRTLNLPALQLSEPAQLTTQHTLLADDSPHSLILTTTTTSSPQRVRSREALVEQIILLATGIVIVVGIALLLRSRTRTKVLQGSRETLKACSAAEMHGTLTSAIDHRSDGSAC